MKLLTKKERKESINSYKEIIKSIYVETEKTHMENAPEFIKKEISKDWLKNEYIKQLEIIFKKIDEFDSNMGNKLISEMELHNKLAWICDEETKKFEKETETLY